MGKIMIGMKMFTLSETNISPENRPGPKRKLVFQPSIFRCYISLGEGIVIVDIIVVIVVLITIILFLVIITIVANIIRIIIARIVMLKSDE